LVNVTLNVPTVAGSAPENFTRTYPEEIVGAMVNEVVAVPVKAAFFDSATSGAPNPSVIRVMEFTIAMLLRPYAEMFSM
jgi:hypothetical protein